MDVTEWPPEDIGSNLNLWNWYDSWAEYAIDAFGEEFDVDVSNSGYSSPDQWYSQLQAGNDEIDNIAATTNWVERSIENDFLHELPVDMMPAWENITDRIKQASSYQQDGSSTSTRRRTPGVSSGTTNTRATSVCGTTPLSPVR
jgi:spermidine/putrescine transport system substrate-binding protein